MSSHKQIVLTGATGEIGSALMPALMKEGYQVIAFTRDPETARHKVPGADDYATWNIDDTNQWAHYLDNAYGVINCAGENMFAKRYTKAYGQLVVGSRIMGTRALIDAMQQVAHKPAVFINSSSQGFYGITDFDDHLIDENAPAGRDKWGPEAALIDREAYKAETLGVRVVSLRIGYVLDWRGNGGLPAQVERERKGQGGAITPLAAWRSWIHIDDLVSLYLFALRNEQVNGPLNATAPTPVTSEHFANALSLAVIGKPNKRKFPGFMLRLFMGPAADIITHGKRIIPRKALDLGFKFRYPTLEGALQDLIPKLQANSLGIAHSG
jgi:uncharacterized protein